MVAKLIFQHSLLQPSVFSYYYQQCKKNNSVKFIVKNWQLWLPEFYRKKYGDNILGFNLNLQLNTVISLTDIMLIYQPIKVLKSVLVPLKYTDNHQMQVVM